MERRLIIKEDERNEILNLHRKYISEQFAGQGEDDFVSRLTNDNQTIPTLKTKPATQIQTNQPDVSTLNPIQQQPSGAVNAIQQAAKLMQGQQPPVSNQPQGCKGNPKLCQLQTKLNEKFKSGLVVDGKWGPSTASAVQKALASLTPTTGTPATGTAPAAGTAPATGTAPASGTAPAAGQINKPTTDYSKQFQQAAQNIRQSATQNPFQRR